MKLIVARYREDVSWAEGLNAAIVQKGTDLPNFGREPSSFLWWILNNEVQEDESYAFVQGNPFDHCPRLLDILPPMVDQYLPLGTWQATSDGRGLPFHEGVPVSEYCTRWSIPFSGMVTFWAGGQFAVPGTVIHKYPGDWYQQVFDDVMAADQKGKGNSLVPHVLERMWPTIFNYSKE